MNYCEISSDMYSHIETLINFLYEEVISAGGDGDGLWYSRFYNVKDIFPIVEKINNTFRYKWNLSLDKDTIEWGEGQEGLTITNNKEYYDNAPDWQQILIKY